MCRGNDNNSLTKMCRGNKPQTVVLKVYNRMSATVGTDKLAMEANWSKYYTIFTEGLAPRTM